jgi:hypothetical protein
VDCGAYDRDTIRGLVEETDGRLRRIIGFEADPENFSSLENYLAKTP